MQVTSNPSARLFMAAAATLALAQVYGSTGVMADDNTNRPDIMLPKPKPPLGRASSHRVVCVHPKARGCERTLRGALLRTPAGGTIVVQSRTNWASRGLTMNKPVTLCAGETNVSRQVCGNQKDDYFSIDYKPSSRKSRGPCIAVHLKPTQSADIRGLRINVHGRTVPYACIWAAGGQLRLSDSEITGVRNTVAILIEGGGAHIVRARIYSNKDGINIGARNAHVTLIDSQVSNHDHGIIQRGGIFYATGNRIDSNDYAGIRINGGRALLVRNMFSNNGGSGIRIDDHAPPTPVTEERLSEQFPVLLLHNKFVGNDTSVQWNREPVWARTNGILPMQNCFPGSPVQDWPMVRAFENHFLDPEQIAPVSRANCDTLFNRRGDKGLRHACYAYYEACVAPWPRHQEMPGDDVENEAGAEHSAAKEAAGDRDAMD